MGAIKRCLCNDKPMTDKDYSVSKIAMITGGASLSCGLSFVTGSYFSALLKYLGASEVTSNFILSLATIPGFFLIILPYITANLKFKKPFSVCSMFFECLPLGIAFLLPVITGKTMFGVIFAAFLFVLHSITTYFRVPVNQEWMISCVEGRGGASAFFGLKDGIGNAVLIITYLVLGIITKHFVGEKEVTGYVIMGSIAIIMWLITFISYVVMKEPYNPSNTKTSVNVFKMLWQLVTYKPYKQFFIYQLLYIFATYLTSSLMSVMNVQVFGMKLEILSYFTVIDLVLRVILSVVFGKLADKKGTKPVIAIGMIAYAVNAALYLFMTAQNAYLLKFISIPFCAVAGSAVGAPAFIYIFECLPEQNRSSFIACHNIIILILATIVAFVSATFVDVMHGFNIEIFGKIFTEMNIVFFFSAVAFVIATVHLLTSHKKDKMILQ